MESTLEEIKSKIDLVDFISAFVSLKKTGRNFKGNCPFHQEKTPSFVVSPERQIWHCFGACQEGGDVFKFIMKQENISFIEAVKELADKLGIKLKRFEYQDKVWEKKERLLAINSLAKDYFSYILEKSQFGEKARDYLEKRKINSKVIKKFELGYAPASWNSLQTFLQRKKFSQNEIYDVGLLVKNDQGRFYDRFRGRLVFPLKDARGNTIGFSGRLLDPDEKNAKYVNSPETAVYHKRESLFGIHLAKEAIKKEGRAVLVEGEFDVISPYQHGLENFVAIKGSAVTEEQLLLLKRYTNRIDLALDADVAGEEAIKRGIQAAEKFDFDIGIIVVTGGKDPDEAVQKDPAAFKENLKKVTPVYDFIIDINLKKYPGNDPYSKKKIVDEVIPYFVKIRNPVVSSYYIKKLARLMDIDEKSIETLMRRFYFKEKKREIFRPVSTPVDRLSREAALQKYILSLIFQNRQSRAMVEDILKILELDDFFNNSYRKIFELYVKSVYDQKIDFQLNDFVKLLPAEARPVFDEIYLFASAESELGETDYKKLAYEIKRYSLKKKIREIMAGDTVLTTEKEQALTLMNNKINEMEKSMDKL
jgi:DNA primase